MPGLKNEQDTWMMSFKSKKELFGEARILPSGRPDVDSDLVGSGAQRVTQIRKDADVEPVAYHGLSKELWEELLHQVGTRSKIKCIIDCTPLETTLSRWALENHVPYLGICLTEFHRDAFRRQLCKQVFQSFQNPKSELYKPRLAALLSGKTQPAVDAMVGTMGGDAPDDDEQALGQAAKKKQKKANSGASARDVLLEQLQTQVGVKPEAVVTSD